MDKTDQVLAKIDKLVEWLNRKLKRSKPSSLAYKRTAKLQEDVVTLKVSQKELKTLANRFE